MTDTSVANTNFVFHVDRNLLTEFIAALHVYHDSFILLSVLPETISSEPDLSETEIHTEI